LQEDRMDEQPVMYIGMDSMGLVMTAPREEAVKALDLCSGSGIQAISASRYAASVIGVDVQPRAIRFARFNAQLNGIDNVEFRMGDLYAVVSGEKFDTILANPPFVPSPDSSLTFRDGGTEGESILRRIIKESPEHLTPTGRLHIVTDLVDLKSYEDKLNSWWKGGGADMLVLHTADRDEILFSVPHCHWPFDQTFEDYNAELDQWIRNFRNANLTAVNFGYILIQRQPEILKTAFFSRCIHNPATAIHNQTKDYFKQRRMLGKIGAEPCNLDVESSLQVRINRGIKESDTHIELYVEDNPYFTTYSINRSILLDLQSIVENRPDAANFIHSGNRGWIEDLIGKGVLRLQAMTHKMDKTAVHPLPTRRTTLTVDTEKNFHSEQKPNLGIEELATKTTPTCLSSYLRS